MSGTVAVLGSTTAHREPVAPSPEDRPTEVAEALARWVAHLP